MQDNIKLYEKRLYLLKTLSNLHVGNGETNYSVIDKQVQKDPLTSLPQINSSSLKGALREFVTMIDSQVQSANGNHNDEHAKALCTTVFGSEPTEQNKPIAGKCNFFDAKLLSLPVRTNEKPFMRATSKEALQSYIQSCNIFGLDHKLDLTTLSTSYRSDNQGSIIIEENEWTYDPPTCQESLAFIGEDVILLEDAHFRTLAKELPFVARNYLENGKSENLWYEEIVPRESLFYFVVQEPTETLMHKNDKKTIKAYLNSFVHYIDDKKLFIGANTTVGYGLCYIKQHCSTHAIEHEEAQDG